MKLLAISDGVVGHYKKTAAVVQHIQRRTSCDVQWLEARMRIGFYRNVLDWYLNRPGQIASPRRLGMFYRLRESPDARPDLIVACGGRVSFVAAWLTRYHKCPSILLGPVRRLAPEYFARIITTRPIEGDERYILSPPLTEIRPEFVENEARAFQAAESLPECRRCTLLLGGGGNGYHFTANQWQSMADDIVRLANRYGIRWLITTSRRTPRAAERIFCSPAVQQVVDDIVVWRHDKRPVFNAMLGCGDVIFCTEDSANMLTEAVAAGRPVVSIRPGDPREELRFLRFLGPHLTRVPVEELNQIDIDELSAGYQAPDLMEPVWKELDNYLEQLRAA